MIGSGLVVRGALGGSGAFVGLADQGDLWAAARGVHHAFHARLQELHLAVREDGFTLVQWFAFCIASDENNEVLIMLKDIFFLINITTS